MLDQKAHDLPHEVFAVDANGDEITWIKLQSLVVHLSEDLTQQHCSVKGDESIVVGLVGTSTLQYYITILAVHYHRLLTIMI